MEEKIRVLISEEDVNKKISEVASQISRDYEGKEVHLIKTYYINTNFGFYICKNVMFFEVETIPIYSHHFVIVSSFKFYI